MLKLKLQYFGHLMQRVDSLEKTLMLGGIGVRRRRGRQRMRWHHWLAAHEFGWSPGVGDGQGGLACCDSWGCKESDTTEQLNWPESYNRKIIQLGLTHSYEHIKRGVFSSWLQIGSQILEAWGKFESPAAAVMWQGLWDWPKAQHCKQNVGAESIFQLTVCKRKKPSVLQPQGTEFCQLTQWASW